MSTIDSSDLATIGLAIDFAGRLVGLAVVNFLRCGVMQ